MREQPDCVRPFALLLGLVLAGCVRAPRPEAPPTDLQDPCGAIEMALDPADGSVSRQEGTRFTVLLRNLCAEALTPAFAGRCAGELFQVSLRHEDRSWRLARDGDATDEAPCGDAGIAGVRVLAQNESIEARYRWNATVEGAPAALGDWWLDVRASSAEGGSWTSTAYLSVHPFCVDLLLDPAGAGERTIDVTFDRTHAASYTWIAPEDPRPAIRWCGEAGEHELRYQDPGNGIDERARIVLDAPAMRILPSPLRVERV